MSTFRNRIKTIQQEEDRDTLTAITETFLADIISQIDILDPEEDQEELLNTMASDDPEIIWRFILGLQDLDTYIEESLEEIQDENDE